MKVADDHFAFTTAESGGGGEGMFKRMAAVETGLSDMKGMIEELLKAQGQRQEAREPAEPLLGARAKAGTGRQRSGAQGQGLGNLDPGTVGAA